MAVVFYSAGRVQAALQYCSQTSSCFTEDAVNRYRSALRGAGMNQSLACGVRPGPSVSQDVLWGHAAVAASEMPQAENKTGILGNPTKALLFLNRK